MMNNMFARGGVALATAGALVAATPALAGWKVVPQGQRTQVAKSAMSVSPADPWNRNTKRPSTKGESWTLDGESLNQVSFFAGLDDGETIYKDKEKKEKPLPKFKSSMLPTDVVTLFEASNRLRMDTSLFSVDKVEPAKLGKHDGVRFEYHYALQGDQLNRKGEGIAAVVGGKLYLVNFVAPEIHYFDRDVPKFRRLVQGLSI